MSLKVKQRKVSIEEHAINFDDVKKAASIIRALNNPIRRRLIDLLLKNETISVSNIVINLREQQTVISQHLNILRNAKMVTFLKKGKNVYYFVNRSRVSYIQKCLSLLFEENVADSIKKIEKNKS